MNVGVRVSVRVRVRVRVSVSVSGREWERAYLERVAVGREQRKPHVERELLLHPALEEGGREQHASRVGRDRHARRAQVLQQRGDAAHARRIEHRERREGRVHL